MTSKLNRRLFLSYGAAAGTAAIGAGLHPWTRMALAQDLAGEKLRTTGLSVTVQDRILEMFRAASGVGSTAGTPSTFPMRRPRSCRARPISMSGKSSPSVCRR